ncbi:hypothetical protein OR1_01235 [Geobacter sp. OR-1]|uniref:hypothetical protein n=1 Tax=Geobacter sp. OR-1 TaxID=1266765 RepID=UPI00054264B5|nr:hypothetical protein [Geobacter sp. OR-1]GAM08961.1 hypothetical protein OR1_01235 [Geobacter sp. OR-1]
MKRVIELFMAGLIFLAIALLVVFPLRDFDTFWHVANGRIMVETSRIANQELFSYTAAGTHFYNHEWLAQIIMFLFYRAGEITGLLIFKLLMTLALVWVLFRTARFQGTGILTSSLLCLGVVYAGLLRFVERPQLFSFLGIAVVSYILYTFRADDNYRRRLYPLPLIIALWDTLHGALYGCLLLAAFTVGETVKFYFAGRVATWFELSALPAGRLKSLWGWSLATLAVSLVNPYGVLTYKIIPAVFKSGSDVNTAAEFMPPTFSSEFYAFWALFALTIAMLITARRKLDLTHLFIIIPFTILALRYSRCIEAFNLVALPIVASSCARYSQQLTAAGKDRIVWRASLALAVASLAGVAYVKFAPIYRPASFSQDANDYAFGIRLNENNFPVGSLRFIKEVNLTGNMYNTDRYGGYLSFFAFPERKIFHFNEHSIFKVLYSFIHNPETRSKWDINYAIVAREDEVDMFSRDGYVPVYWEPSAMVMLKDTPRNKGLLERYRIRYFAPLKSSVAFFGLAADGRSYAALVREMGTYLSYRTDKRIAAVFSTLITGVSPDLPPAERLSIIQAAERYNGSPELTQAKAYITSGSR